VPIQRQRAAFQGSLLVCAGLVEATQLGCECAGVSKQTGIIATRGESLCAQLKRFGLATAVVDQLYRVHPLLNRGSTRAAGP
jgi:hypothetical protein